MGSGLSMTLVSHYLQYIRYFVLFHDIDGISGLFAIMGHPPIISLEENDAAAH